MTQKVYTECTGGIKALTHLGASLIPQVSNVRLKLGRTLFGLLIGAVLVSTLAAAPLTVSKAAGDEDEQELLSGGTLTTIFQNALISPLERAAAEAGNTANGNYLETLISSYNLEKLAEDADTASEDDLGGFLPDIKAINESAATMPLVEAGKQIQDEEIANFYYDFLKRAGWNISR